MRNSRMTSSTAACAVLLWLAGLTATLHAAAVDAKLWKTYCDDAKKAVQERHDQEADQFIGMAVGAAESFGEADPRLVETLFMAAGLEQARKRFADAEAHLRRALAVREGRLGTNHLSVAECVFHLGNNLSDQKKFTEAEPLLKRAEHIAKWKTSAYHPTVGTCQAALARNYSLAGRYDEADKLYTAALKILGTQTSTTKFKGGPDVIEERLFVPDYRRVMQIRMEQAQTLHLAKKYKDAEGAFKKLVKLIEDREGKDSVLLVNPLLSFGLHYADVKNYPTAEMLLLQRQSIITQHAGPKHPAHLATKVALERVYREQGKDVEADLLARQLMEAGVKPGAAK